MEGFMEGGRGLAMPVKFISNPCCSDSFSCACQSASWSYWCVNVRNGAKEGAKKAVMLRRSHARTAFVWLASTSKLLRAHEWLYKNSGGWSKQVGLATHPVTFEVLIFDGSQPIFRFSKPNISIILLGNPQGWVKNLGVLYHYGISDKQVIRLLLFSGTCLKG